MTSTACWRRYVGSWEIKDERLWLIGLTGAWHLEGQEPLWAEWFSGVLRVPTGPLLQYVHQGFSSVYAEELLITVENGRVVRRERVDHRPKIVGWLRVKSKTGSATSDLRLFPGTNSFRCIEDKTIFAAPEWKGNLPNVIYDQVQDKFFVWNTEPSEAIRLNGSPLIVVTELKEDDELQFGDASLRLVILRHEGVEPTSNSK